MVLRQKSKSNRALVLLLSLICLCLIAAGVILFLKATGTGSQTIKSVFLVEDLDPNAKTGTLPGSPKEEKPQEENMFSYRINSTPKFSADCSGGNILLENPSYNEYLMVLEIADGNQLIYESQYIAPNQYIEKINLAKKLESGEHPVVAYINAVDPKTMDLVGTLECPITVVVK